MTPSGPRSRPPAWRILVAGAGVPGLALALALARAAPQTVRVTLCDPGVAGRPADPRAYALSPASRRMLEVLGIWDGIATAAQPINGMTITDSRVEDAVRPAYLRFGDGEAPLGFMIAADRLASALADAVRTAGIAVEPLGVAGFETAADHVSVLLSDGGRRACEILVAVDGARSRLRDLAGITWFGRRYPQSGIVATVAHARDHAGRAVQHFLPPGPFAILPLVPGSGGHRSSIVWTERQERVPALLALTRAEAAVEVAARFGRELGPLRLETDLLAHPLSVGLARRFVADRFALLGDAAHEVHPLAGQGLNLALGDAAALAERIVDAARLGLDPGSAEVLAGYERDRRTDAVLLAATTDALNRLFSNDRLPVRVMRDLGLGLVDRAPALKGVFAAQAAGTGPRAPRLMRGEAL